MLRTHQFVQQILVPKSFVIWANTSILKRCQQSSSRETCTNVFDPSKYCMLAVEYHVIKSKPTDELVLQAICYSFTHGGSIADLMHT